jgi:hypothetical protein
MNIENSLNYSNDVRECIGIILHKHTTLSGKTAQVSEASGVMSEFVQDLILKVFLVDDEAFYKACRVGEELNMSFVGTASIYSYLLSYPEAAKGKSLLSLFQRRPEIDIDYSGVCKQLQTFIDDNLELLELFSEKWSSYMS